MYRSLMALESALLLPSSIKDVQQEGLSSLDMTVRRNGEVLFLALKLKQTHSLVISDTVTATPRYIDKMNRFKGLRLDVIGQ